MRCVWCAVCVSECVVCDRAECVAFTDTVPRVAHTRFHTPPHSTTLHYTRAQHNTVLVAVNVAAIITPIAVFVYTRYKYRSQPNVHNRRHVHVWCVLCA